MVRKITLPLGDRSYSLLIGNGILSRGVQPIRRATRAKKIVVLSTKFLFETYGRILYKGLQKNNFTCRKLLIPDGESHKNEKTLLSILSQMARFGLQRDSCLIAVGGGVVGDLGGFASSIYMRGIDFIQCPTTLLAQVDASIGGKTAIDFNGIKNLVGAFHQPKLVLIDPEILKTLNTRQFKTGLAEVIKCGAIQDERLFQTIEEKLETILKMDPKILLYLISRSCEIKAGIVSMDERERGRRAWLNYGHTLGHALESYFNYDVLTHGEAVAYGMWFAAALSKTLGICSEDTLRRQRELLVRAGLLPKLPRFDSRKVYRKMLLDKKARNGRIQFVLTRKIGLVTIQKIIPPSIILSVLSQLQTEAGEMF